MSIINYNLESTFNAPDCYGDSGGYFRTNKDYLMDVCEHWRLRTTLNPQPGDSTLLLGAGFGWIAEEWIAQGLGPICAVDTSEWIQSEKANNAVVEIHSYDITNLEHQLAIKSLLDLQPNEKIKWCITEDFFTGCSDSECLNIAETLRNIGENVVHYISPPPRSPDILPDRNWKTGEQWKSLLSPDKVLIRGTSVLL